VTVSRVLIEQIGELHRKPADRSVAAQSGVVASDGRGVLASRDGTAIRIAARRMLSLMAMGSSLVARYHGRIAYGLQDDLIRADPKELPEPAQLRHLRHPSPAFPEVDRLRLDTDPQRQFKLGPSLFLAKRPDRLHGMPHLTSPNYNRITSDEQLEQMVYFDEKTDARRLPPPL
jgi:hypothetical protein